MGPVHSLCIFWPAARKLSVAEDLPIALETGAWQLGDNMHASVATDSDSSRMSFKPSPA